MTPGSTATLPILRFQLATLVAAQLFDFGTFTIMVGRYGVLAEHNPIVAQGFEAFGLPFLALTKAVLVVLVGSIVVVLGRDPSRHRSMPALAKAVTVLAVLAGLAGGISNTTAG
jgi:hypothetical protein